MKLATVQKIHKIEQIPDADAIELAFVLGWQVVVKKNEYKINDYCCYIQIDTVVPDKPEYEFLKNKKFRVRTIKLRKQLSQGLIVPVPKSVKNYYEGKDLTKELEIKKYEKIDNNPEKNEKPRMPKIWYKKYIYLFKYNILYKVFPFMLSKTRTSFPKNLVSVTDEERIQNVPNVLKTHKDKFFTVSYKFDGSSITIIHNRLFGKSKYRICSRNFELHNKSNDWYKTFVSTNFHIHIDALVKKFQTNDVIVQGECIGKFNGNHHNLSKDEIRLFNIYINGERMLQNLMIATCKELNIPYCNELHEVILLNHTMEEILNMSNIPDLLNPKVPVEGLVWRCINDNLSFKVINNNYLLKTEQ